MSDLTLATPLTYGEVKTAINYWNNNTSKWRNFTDFGRLKNGGCPLFISQLYSLIKGKKASDNLTEEDLNKLTNAINQRALRHNGVSNDKRITETVVNALNKSLLPVKPVELAPEEAKKLREEVSFDETHKKNTSKEETNDNHLGSGNYGTVYRVTYQNKQVAMKILSPKTTHDEYLSELHNPAFRAPPHQNIAKLLAYNSECPRTLVFELGSKGSLDRKILDFNEPLNGEQRIDIAIGLCEGILHLQNYHIGHFDVKPQNIVLNGELKPMLIDFGLSICFQDAEMSFSKSKGDIGGTPDYAAPEVIRLANSKNDKQVYSLRYADVYSLGIVFWCLGENNTQPYGNLPMNNSYEIAFHVNEIADNNKRPTVSKNNPSPLVLAAKNCWKGKPNERTKLPELISFFKEQKPRQVGEHSQAKVSDQLTQTK